MRPCSSRDDLAAPVTDDGAPVAFMDGERAFCTFCTFCTFGAQLLA